MNRRAKYRVFLRTRFWTDLTKKKKEIVGCCERCGSKESLQSHHKHYPQNWFDTTLSDLQVLCRKCHREQHGISAFPFLIFRNDVSFSRRLWRVDSLTRIIHQGYQLTPRDLRFLDLLEKKYPPTPTDGCMEFHIQNCRSSNSLLNR